MKTTLYIVFWHEAITPEDTIAGIFKTESEAEILLSELETGSTGNYWEIFTKEVEL